MGVIKVSLFLFRSKHFFVISVLEILDALPLLIELRCGSQPSEIPWQISGIKIWSSAALLCSEPGLLMLGVLPIELKWHLAESFIQIHGIYRCWISALTFPNRILPSGGAVRDPWAGLPTAPSCAFISLPYPRAAAAYEASPLSPAVLAFGKRVCANGFFSLQHGVALAWVIVSRANRAKQKYLVVRAKKSTMALRSASIRSSWEWCCYQYDQWTFQPYLCQP